MKSSRCIVLAIAASLWLGVAARADAQVRGGFGSRYYRRPVTSPYMNMMKRYDQGNRGTLFQYFREVKPEQEWRKAAAEGRRSYAEIRGKLNQQQTQIQRLRNSQLGTTGHSSRFMNLGGYFGVGAK